MCEGNPSHTVFLKAQMFYQDFYANANQNKTAEKLHVDACFGAVKASYIEPKHGGGHCYDANRKYRYQHRYM